MALHHISTSSELSSLHEQYSYVVVDCYADWCGPCRAIAPVYEKIAEIRSLPGHLAFAKLNVDDGDGELAGELGVSAMPTFLFFEDGSPVEVNGVHKLLGADMTALDSATASLHELATQRQAGGA
ncbi:hypothetical protein VPNG_08577 [Cytospora leucostoma]|uniref:Thioredoxin domain-containing protein n=1 Tax=Cytospora leucostoma TaxID=1230097 RepID=A0A423W4A0_9PEZI|nr:hypothetical protein VPNG_08577 [Cytospora leucostoma]